MKRESVLAICLLAVGAAYPQQRAQQRVIGPQPPVVDPGGPGKPPSDAVVLFNGRNNTGWTRMDGTPSHCTVADGVMTCRTGALDTQSTQKFHDAQIHVEFNVAYEPNEKGYARANSGIILQNLYEIYPVDTLELDRGRLLSARFHNVTGYFRDDIPLVELILDEEGRGLWNGSGPTSSSSLILRRTPGLSISSTRAAKCGDGGGSRVVRGHRTRKSALQR
jgi:hypothetical protein